MTVNTNRLYSVMKMLSLPSSLTLAPIRFTKTKDDIFVVLHEGRYHYIFSSLFAVILCLIYFKLKVYDALKSGKNFFIYIRSLATFIEIACIAGNMMCYTFGARKTARIYKKMKKIIKRNFNETDYSNMQKLFMLEMIIASVFFSLQCIFYFQFYMNSVIIYIIILDSNITVVTLSTCLRHYNMAKMLQICFDKLLKKLEQPIDSKQLHQIWASYLEIYGIVKTANEIFGFGLTCSLAVIYIYCLVALFGICTFFSIIPYVAMVNVSWLSVELCQFLAVVIGTCSCEVTARKLQARLGCYQGEEDHLEEVSEQVLVGTVIMRYFFLGK